jgi:Ca2+-binding RTX toxin-like protein
MEGMNMAKGGGSSAGRYSINGTQGDDFIDGSVYDGALQARGLSVNGAGGNDTIKGGSGADILGGGNGNDAIFGDRADLAGAGGDGRIVWDGGNGTDTLDLSGFSYTDGTGVMLAFYANGDSQIRTDADKNDASMWGPTSWSAIYRSNFQGFENFTLGGGNDTILMTNASINNVIDGGAGNDFIGGGGGNDTINGGAGNDIIDGGWGNDTMYGGTGNDAFSIQGRLAGQYTYDVIKDFDARADSGDASFDAMILPTSWTIVWDSGSPAVLHGYLNDGSTTFGEITFEGLTYADASQVTIGTMDPNTGDLIFG